MNNTRNNRSNRKVNHISRRNNVKRNNGNNGNNVNGNNVNGNNVNNVNEYYYKLVMKTYNKNKLEKFENGYIPETPNPPIDIVVNDYIFKMVIDEDYVNYMFRFTSNSGPEPCIIIFIDKENQAEATIEKVFYSEGCSYSETPLEQKNGTILMLKTALKVATDIFKNIKYFKLKDMSHKYNKNIKESVWITPRRLLQQKPGWYEEFVGATPTNDTKKIKLLIKNFYSKIEENIPKDNLSWWTTENILKLTSIIDRNFLTKNILGTYWIINRKTISDYNLSYDIPNKNNIPVLYNNANNTNIINNNYQLNKFFNRNNTSNK